jgi:hypothetical protein
MNEPMISLDIDANARARRRFAGPGPLAQSSAESNSPARHPLGLSLIAMPSSAARTG